MTTTPCQVDCNGLTFQQLFTYNLLSDASNIAWTNSYCSNTCTGSTVEYKLFLDDCITPYADAGLAIDESTGDITISGNMEMDSSYLVLKTFTTDPGLDPATSCSNPFKIQTICGSGSTVLTWPATMDSKITTPFYEGDTIIINFDQVTSSNPGCPIINYYAIDANGASAKYNGDHDWELQVDGTVNFIDTSGTVYTQNGYKYTFDLYATAKGGVTSQFSQRVTNTLQYQGPCPNVITEDSIYYNSLSAIQVQPVASTQRFYLPSFNFDYPSCAGAKSFAMTGTHGALLNSPVYDSTLGVYYVTPADTSVEFQYSFQVTVSDDRLTQLLSSVYTLTVGCPTTVASQITVTFGTSFLPTAQMTIAQSNMLAYTIKYDSQTFNIGQFCELTSRAINVVSYEDLMGADTPQPSLTTATPVTQCTADDCGAYDISSTQNILRIKFTVDLVFGGTQYPSVKIITTPEVTLEIVCAMGNTVVSPSDFVTQTFDFPVGYSINSTISFEEFTCDITDCCVWEATSFELVDASTNTPISATEISCCSDSVVSNTPPLYTFTVANVATAQTITFKIKGMNSFGDYAFSEPLTVTIFDPVPQNTTLPYIITAPTNDTNTTNMTASAPEPAPAANTTVLNFTAPPSNFTFQPQWQSKKETPIENIAAPEVVQQIQEFRQKFQQQADDVAEYEDDLDEDYRERIQIYLNENTAIGEVKLYFSERLRPIDEIQDVNLTTISNDLVFDIQYTTFVGADIEQAQIGEESVDEDQIKIPKLQKWYVQNFTADELIFRLNFTHPLYVSTDQQLDTIKINFLLPELFQSKKDGYAMVIGPNITGYVPRQTNSDDRHNAILSLSNNSSVILLISLILPIVFKLLFNFGMIVNLIYDLFNMLQIVANIQNYQVSERIINGKQILPSSVDILLQVVDSTVNFKPLQNPLIKEQINKLTELVDIVDFVNQFGLLFIGLIIATVTILLLVALMFLCKNSEKGQSLLKKILKSLMWGSVIRFLLQGYMVMSLNCFHSITVFTTLPINQQFIDIVLILIVFSVPVLSLLFFVKYHLKLEVQEIQERYGTLYQGQKTNFKRSNMSVWFTPQFFITRLLIALSTILLREHPLFQIASFIFISLFMLSFSLSVRPFAAPLLNSVNILNGFCILSSSYFLLLLTDMVPSMEAREEIAWSYLYSLVSVVALNFLLVGGKVTGMILRKQVARVRARMNAKRGEDDKDAEQKEEKESEEMDQMEQQQEIFMNKQNATLDELNMRKVQGDDGLLEQEESQKAMKKNQVKKVDLKQVNKEQRRLQIINRVINEKIQDKQKRQQFWEYLEKDKKYARYKDLTDVALFNLEDQSTTSMAQEIVAVGSNQQTINKIFSRKRSPKINPNISFGDVNHSPTIAYSQKIQFQISPRFGGDMQSNQNIIKSTEDDKVITPAIAENQQNDELFSFREKNSEPVTKTQHQEIQGQQEHSGYLIKKKTEGFVPYEERLRRFREQLDVNFSKQSC